MRRNSSKRRKKKNWWAVLALAAVLIIIIILRMLYDSEKKTSEDLSPEDLVLEDEGFPENSLDQLKGQLEEMLGGVDGTWSIYVKNLGNGDEISINNQRMYAASLIKLFVMESCYANMDQIIENDSPYSGNTELSREKVYEVMQDMIQVSDNEAYNELVRMHSSQRSFSEGCQFIEDYLLNSEYTDTGIFHTLEPSETEAEMISDEENYTSVEDCAAILEKIYNGTCVSEEASEEMLDLLFGQQVQTKIAAGLPEGVRCANKTGETDENEHDAAIVFGPNTDYIICVMSSDVYDDPEAAVREIQEISSVVYQAVCGGY